MVTTVLLHVRDERSGLTHTFVLGELSVVFARPFTIGSDPGCSLVVASDDAAPVHAALHAASNHRYVTAYATGVTVGYPKDDDWTSVAVGQSQRVDLRSFRVASLVVSREEVSGERAALPPPPTTFPARLGAGTAEPDRPATAPQTQTQTQTKPKASAPPRRLFIARDGRVIASNKKSSRIWSAGDLAENLASVTSVPHEIIGVLPDGSTLDVDDGSLLERDETGAVRRSTRIFDTPEPAEGAAVSADGHRVVLWTAGSRLLSFLDRRTASVVHIDPHAARRAADDAGGYRHATWSPSGKRLVLVDVEDHFVEVVIDADQPRAGLDVRWRGSWRAVSPIDHDAVHVLGSDGELLRWHTSDGDLKRGYVSLGRVSVATFDGDIVAVAAVDRHIRVWDATDMERGGGTSTRQRLLADFVGHTHEITAVALDARSGVVVSGDAGGVIRRWRIGHATSVAL